MRWGTKKPAGARPESRRRRRRRRLEPSLRLLLRVLPSKKTSSPGSPWESPPRTLLLGMAWPRSDRCAQSRGRRKVEEQEEVEVRRCRRRRRRCRLPKKRSKRRSSRRFRRRRCRCCCASSSIYHRLLRRPAEASAPPRGRRSERRLGRRRRAAKRRGEEAEHSSSIPCLLLLPSHSRPWTPRRWPKLGPRWRPQRPSPLEGRQQVQELPRLLAARWSLAPPCFFLFQVSF